MSDIDEKIIFAENLREIMKEICIGGCGCMKEEKGRNYVKTT